MKVAIITDTHFGARSDNPSLLKHQQKFFKDTFFPTLKKEGIDTIFHMGDLFDKRKYINYNSLKLTKEMFLDPIKNNNIKMHIIAGNHDVFLKNSNEINSLQLLLPEYMDNIFVYHDSIKEIKIGKTSIVMVPWLNPENTDRILASLNKSKCDYVMGHFEIVGFAMSGGEKCKHGLDSDLFSNSERVFSGHFHVPSQKGNIEYIGAPYQMDWSDYKGERGFYVMDCDTKTMDFIKNPIKLFNVVEYDDENATLADLEDFDGDLFKDTFIRIHPTNVTNQALFDKFVKQIENFDAADIKIRELPTLITETAEDGEVAVDFEIDDTETFMAAYVDKMKYSEEMSALIKSKLNNMYKRCKE